MLLIFPIKFDHVYSDFLILLEKAIPKSEQYLEDISKVIFQKYRWRYINTFHKEKSVHFYKAITVIYFSYTRIYPIFDPCGYEKNESYLTRWFQEVVDGIKEKEKKFAYILFRLIDDSSPFNFLITFTAHECSNVLSFAREKRQQWEYNSESWRGTESCREWSNYVFFVNLALRCCLIFLPRFLLW